VGYYFSWFVCCKAHLFLPKSLRVAPKLVGPRAGPKRGGPYPKSTLD